MRLAAACYDAADPWDFLIRSFTVLPHIFFGFFCGNADLMCFSVSRARCCQMSRRSHLSALGPAEPTKKSWFRLAAVLWRLCPSLQSALFWW
eukprot:g48845.t1